MNGTVASSGRRRLAALISALLAVEACMFFLFAALHLGIRLAGVGEPRIIAIVESVCGASLALAAGAIFARTTWAWPAAIVAHAIAIAGVLLGIAALAAGAGPTTLLNFVYHRAILSLLIVGAIVVATGPGRRALLLDR